MTSSPQGLIDLEPRLGGGAVAGRGTPAYLPFSASFAEHLRRIGGDSSGVGQAGIDYAPHMHAEPTLICPVAAGVVIAHRDSLTVSGMTLTIAHGLGWKSEYAHLEARFVGYGSGRVERGDVIAVMGASGTGAARGGTRGPLRHLHLNQWAPAYTPLYRRLVVQSWPGGNQGVRHLVDAEDFSLAGRAQGLPYRRPEDGELDRAFLETHDAAVRYCDELLNTLDDAEAAAAKRRNQWEQATEFAYNVDQRIWYLWQRLEGGRHRFGPGEAGRHRAALLEFINTVPRLTAPVVEAARAGDYRMLRTSPIRTYKDERNFGGAR